MQDEFCSIAFRKKIYNSLEEMQKDVTLINGLIYAKMREAIVENIVSAKPMQTFLDSKVLAKAKDVNNLFENRNFKLSDEAEATSAEEHVSRNNPNDGNDKAVEKNTIAFILKSFLSQIPQKTCTV